MDVADYRDKTTAVTVTLNGATAVTLRVGGVAEDTLREIEGVFGGSVADTVIGDALDNLFRGGGGADIFDGASGLDVLDLRDKTVATSITLNGATNAVALVGGVGEDTVRNVEGVYGGSAIDTVNGDALGNLFRGGGGADVFDGFAGLDTVDFSDKTSAVVLTLNGATNAVARVGGINEDTVRNVENVIGGSAADTLIGDALGNALTGGDGDDFLRGQGGADVLDGGAGADTADYREKTVSIDVTLNGAGAGAVLVAGVAEDTLRNVENVTGGVEADILRGDALANALNGYTGKDTLTGGLGADRFVFNNLTDSTVAAGGRDIIADFSRTQGDKIDLRGLDAVTGGTDNAFVFSTALANGAAGRLIVTANGTDNWLVQGDVNGDGVADFAIEVISTVALVATDFLL
jgi:Ca2+-binding RTX toxin-like protein